MKGLLLYLLQVIIASGLLYGYYYAALRNKKFHQYNRFYLLATIPVSILVPFLDIPVYFSSLPGKSSFVLQTLSAITSPGNERSPLVSESTAVTSHLFSWQTFAWIFYGCIAFVALS